MGGAMASMGDRPGALQQLEKLRAAETRTETALLEACIYAGLGETDEMFRLLNDALRKKCAPLYIFMLNVDFRRYKQDPRHSAFLRSMGVPPFAKA
jgi:hypothetical protein